MQVRIEGKIVERSSYFICDEGRGPFDSITREEPDLLDGEQVFWMLGDPSPTIIQEYVHE